jgi:hypothetical protein
MEAESKPARVQKSAHDKFGLCVRAADRLHVAAAIFRAQIVGH